MEKEFIEGNISAEGRRSGQPLRDVLRKLDRSDNLTYIPLSRTSFKKHLGIKKKLEA